MKLLIIFGAQAVGKMTVGQELAKITDLRLFHNHMTIDLSVEVFGEPNINVVQKMRQAIFEEFAKSDNYGLIFTTLWSLDNPASWELIYGIQDIFARAEASIYYVELVASQEVRLARNITENRLRHKPIKKDVDLSRKLLLDYDENRRAVSYDGEFDFENYIKINNSGLSAEIVAQVIKDKFGFEGGE